ncbi:MAG: hypothetical protein UZ22_OP11002000545 [Microgenomates bacterium OLB23]|nr:MAG: hypothetical protein UZ22_OP11002000545 [Microgenomates bacterium OLB23]
MDLSAESLIPQNDLADVQNEASGAGESELASVLAAEVHERYPVLLAELDQLGPSPFPIDLYYELMDALETTRKVFSSLRDQDGGVLEDLRSIEELLRGRNPLEEILTTNMGYVLLHSSDTRSVGNLLRGEFRYPHAQICTSATKLRDRDGVFRSTTKTLEAGVVYDPRDAVRWFSKDVGSHTREGQRVYLDKHRPFERASLQDALDSQGGSRIEAWVDAAIVRPSGLVVLDQRRTDEILGIGHQYNLPVIVNGNL